MNKSFFYTRKIFDLYGFRKAFSFFIHAQFYRKAFARWFDFVEMRLPADMSDFLKIRLATRPAYRFIDRKLGVAGRIAALTSHYTLLAKNFSPSAVSEFINGYQLAEITGQSGKKYAIKVVTEITKEGVMRIMFVDTSVGAGASLATLAGAFSLDDNQRPVFLVGMLRGPGRRLTDGKQRIVDATRDLNGLRPKQAVVHAAAALAEWFQAGEIVAPSTDNQIAIMNWFKGQRILADHDPFWQEFAKEPAPDGSYHLLLPLPRRDIADVQRKRRKDWLLRYEEIDAMSAKIKATLEGLAGRAKAA
jgi:hypothetical protein